MKYFGTRPLTEELIERFRACRADVYLFMYRLYECKEVSTEGKMKAFPVCVEREVKSYFPDPNGVYHDSSETRSPISAHRMY